MRPEIACPELSRFLYTAVGGAWFWVDRLPWTHERWLEYLSRPGFETWLASVKGTPAGYYELDGEAGGVRRDRIVWRAAAVYRARDRRTPINPCRASGVGQRGHTGVAAHLVFRPPRDALTNYQARGFRLVHQETCPKDLPEVPPGPWPGAK